MSLRVGSLFSGCGALDLAVTAWFGGTVAWHVENDPHASAVLARHYPDVPNHSDITAVDWGAVEPVDVLCGGFPCQDLSYAGKGAGITGRRSGLWSSYADAIRALRPRHVVVENVTALLARGFGVVHADLASLGYDTRWTCIRASDIGACHRRDRLFLLATDAQDHQPRLTPRDGRMSPVGIPTAGAGHRAHPRHPASRVPVVGRSARTVAADGLTLLPTPVVNDMGDGKTPERWDEWTADMRDRHGNGNGHGRSLAIEVQRLLPTPTARESKDSDAPGREGGASLCVVARDANWGDYAPAIARHEHVLGRPAPPPTDAEQRLSPRFVEWMMMLPDGWVDGPSRSQQLKMLGNSVVSPQAYAALTLLADIGEEQAA